jgi:hypothetical protein
MQPESPVRARESHPPTMEEPLCVQEGGATADVYESTLPRRPNRESVLKQRPIPGTVKLWRPPRQSRGVSRYARVSARADRTVVRPH